MDTIDRHNLAGTEEKFEKVLFSSFAVISPQRSGNLYFGGTVINFYNQILKMSPLLIFAQLTFKASLFSDRAYIRGRGREFPDRNLPFENCFGLHLNGKLHLKMFRCTRDYHIVKL